MTMWLPLWMVPVNRLNCYRTTTAHCPLRRTRQSS
ncbi:hypothetical protein F443_15219 [Phytophthora nicotianae P1569]|uniref:Uncharacterized protein n=1 Tax=Phytophthora nicotianae P1569 TaxID=1317065 RepID=V9EJ07_PHYNI|nr:hypothetical protein F443_15219 [Phytophthora nicotianae P1569]